MMVQLDLWDEMRALEQRMDDLFRAFLGPLARTTFPALPTGLRRPFLPATDVLRADGELVLRIELPGIDPKKDVEIVVEDDQLVVRGERKELKEVREEAYERREVSYGAFERRFAVPEGLDEKKVKAEYRDRILEIHLPAAAEVKTPKAKAIPVKVAEAA